VLRPAAGILGDARGVGGIFQIDNLGRIISFREIFNTPVMNHDDLLEKGSELFRWMVKHDDVFPYERNPDFVEWPNKVSRYDTVRHEWLIIQ
jgi:hypothetical protein